MFAPWSTRDRPYISLIGPRNSGPTAAQDQTPSSTDAWGCLPYARMKMDVVSAMRASLVMPNCTAIWSAAGATMEDETGEMNVNADTIAVAAHFFLYDQLRGSR